ncbi:MAG: 3-deoxy-7-phosphoheptulonate synthase [Pyrinomonadaceae bacterium]|nr:3-deoxy-7-phosphoheptulonate synthase [Pyrinomonadaceae bacterium]
MIITMTKNATREEIESIIKRLETNNFQTGIAVNGRVHIAAIGKGYADEIEKIRAEKSVEKIENPVNPFILASRQMNVTGSIVKVKNIEIGGNDVVVIAGPCSVESREQVLSTAKAVKKAGAVMLRGGAYKPRTSPYEFQGLGVEGLRILREVGDETDLPIVTEVMSEDDIEIVSAHADMLQIGARNMQNFALLRKIAKTKKPILLKRGASATVKEWLLAAEYVLAGGNENVVLCERGIKTFDTSLRNTLDLAAVALVKELSHLPVIVDPSHATGKRSIVPILAKAALAVGADGVIVEVHPKPETALSDGAQSLTFQGFTAMMEELTQPVRRIAEIHEHSFA